MLYLNTFPDRNTLLIYLKLLTLKIVSNSAYVFIFRQSNMLVLKVFAFASLLEKIVITLRFFKYFLCFLPNFDFKNIEVIICVHFNLCTLCRRTQYLHSCLHNQFCQHHLLIKHLPQ
jgi:hypothetical protein